MIKKSKLLHFYQIEIRSVVSFLNPFQYYESLSSNCQEFPCTPSKKLDLWRIWFSDLSSRHLLLVYITFMVYRDYKKYMDYMYYTISCASTYTTWSKEFTRVAVPGSLIFVMEKYLPYLRHLHR